MVELLAPVGDFECLKAAVQNGADAVYFGGGNFNARASAHNFDGRTLILFGTGRTSQLFLLYRPRCIDAASHRPSLPARSDQDSHRR